MTELINTWIHEIEYLIWIGSYLMIVGTIDLTAQWKMMKYK